MRRAERKRRWSSASNLRLLSFSAFAFSYQRQSFTKLRKSERSSASSLCARSAASCWSSGRSRGSCTESPEQMMRSSERLPNSLPANNMRASFGSTGRRESSRPIFVSSPSGVSARSSCRIEIPSAIARGGGAWRKGNSRMSPSLSALARKMTAARFVRKISGSVKAGRRAKSSSS